MPLIRSHIISQRLAGLALVFFLSLCGIGSSQAPPDSSFRWNGRLTHDGLPAAGGHQFHFTLYDAAEGGNAVATTGPLSLTVLGGYFAVTLDFGPTAFTGGKRWLQTSAKADGAPDFALLTPRTALRPAPYALHASHATTARKHASTAVSSNAVAQPNQRYIIDSASQITITLPVSPAVGDIVAIAGIGAGGFAVAQNPEQRIRTHTLTCLCDNGTSWTTPGTQGSLSCHRGSLELQFIGNNTFAPLRHEGTFLGK